MRQLTRRNVLQSQGEESETAPAPIIMSTQEDQAIQI